MPKLQTGSWRKDRKRGNRVVVPTVLLGKGTQQIYVQGGHCFLMAGQHVPTIPDWVIEELKGMPKKQLAALGFDMKFGKPVPAKAAPKPPEPPDPDPDEDDEKEDAEE